MSQGPPVVFLHGLARTHRSLSGLQSFVARSGYSTWARTYPSRRLSVRDLADTVADWITGEFGREPVMGVTHSLGGVLARFIGPRVNWKSLLMLAPPNRGSRVAAGLKFHPMYRWFYGPAGQELAECKDWPQPPSPFGVIAGTSGATLSNPPSWAVRTLKLLPRDAAHDGTVAAFETQLPGMACYAEVPASHTFIMNHPATRALVLEFLAEGRFQSPPNSPDPSSSPAPE